MEARGQFHAPTALPLGTDPQLPIGYEAEWIQSWSRRCEEETNICPRRESNTDSTVVQPVT
jgi:hypothetical protein